MADVRQPQRYEEARAPEPRDPDVANSGVRDAGMTPTHQSMARTAPPRRTGPIVAALAITVVIGLVGAWLWVQMGPALGVTALGIGVVFLLVMMTLLRGKRRPQQRAEASV